MESSATDGRARVLRMRPLRPGDRAAVSYVLAQLGPRSRHRRWLSTAPGVERGELVRLMELDHWHHEVLIATLGDPRTPVGVADYVRTGRFDTAEIALAVSDRFHRQGIGRALIVALADRALAAGIRHLTATALCENRAALELARVVSPAAAMRRGGGVCELDVALGATPARPAPAGVDTIGR